MPTKKKSKPKISAAVKAAYAKQVLNAMISAVVPPEREFDKYSLRGGCIQDPKGNFVPFVELVIGGNFVSLSIKNATDLVLDLDKAVKMVTKQAIAQTKRGGR